MTKAAPIRQKYAPATAQWACDPASPAVSEVAVRTGVAVLESRWARRSNLSIRPAFDLVCGAYGLGPDAYEYEMVGSRAALREAAVRLTRTEKVELLYLASHGDEDGSLSLHSGEEVDPKFLRTTLARCGSSLRGVYLGACFAGQSEIAEKLLAACARLIWVAGYSRRIDFVDSTALDMMFFNRWLASSGPTRARIEAVGAHLAPRVRGLIRAKGRGLGFSVRVRKQGKIADLLGE